MEWFSHSPWAAWLAVALILAAIEAATVDFVFVMLAGGALAGALTAGLGGGPAAQVVVAVVVACLLLGIVRPIVRKRFMDVPVDHGIGAASLVGRHARALTPITDTTGRVKLDGETWSARTPADSPEVAAGSDLRVLALEGATAIVVLADPAIDPLA